MKKILFVALLGAAFLMSSCCACRKAQNIRPIAGSSWLLIEMDGSVIDRKDNPERFSLTFTEDNRIVGQGDCNRYFGGYRINGDSLLFGMIGASQMFCPNQDSESEYFAKMQQTNRYKMDGDFLILMKNNETLVSFKYAPQIKKQ